MPVFLLALIFAASGVAAQGPDRSSDAAVATGLDTQRLTLQREFLLARLVAPPATQGGNLATLDLSPLAQSAVACVRSWGVSLDTHRDMKGSKVAVSALLTVAENLPAVQLHVGASAAGPFGAFYQREKGLRLSLTYPMGNFLMRVEGGKRGEYGNVAMAGLQWVHPERPVAAGFGMPMLLNGADGAVGAVFQVRYKFK